MIRKGEGCSLASSIFVRGEKRPGLSIDGRRGGGEKTLLFSEGNATPTLGRGKGKVRREFFDGQDDAVPFSLKRKVASARGGESK